MHNHKKTQNSAIPDQVKKQIDALYTELKSCAWLDQIMLKKRLRNLNKINDAEKLSEVIEKLKEDVAEAQARLEQRVNRELHLSFPENLPISQAAEELVEAVEKNQVVIVAGETGSGKTTQLPKVCLAAGRGRKGLIGHTQPRRLAARTVSNRIAEELQVKLGDVVGYQVRFTDQVSDQTMVKLMTDGILLSEIKHDRYLNRYDTIIIDEAHERSLNIDFLLGYLKQLLPKRPELKVVITSATIDVERFSKHFEDAPIFKVSGRTYPVDVEYRPLFDEEVERSFNDHVVDVLEEIQLEERKRSWPVGDVLVFLPGEREIRELSKHLRHHAQNTGDLQNTEVLPLYARLNNQDQNKIFQSHAGRRIVLSTNVAETSITVPGIRYVIDSGQVRMSRYSYRSKLQRLPVEAVSQASANQRMGRCGRVAEGICYRLYSEEDFIGRPEFTDPEILRTNLAAVILKMLDAKLGEVHRFPFIDPPDKRLWNDGYKLLFELGAVDELRNLSKLGRQVASIPTDPKLARILIEAAKENCVKQVLVIVSALSIQDPRERPSDKQQAADQAHAEFRDAESDFISFLNLWNTYEEKRQELGSNQLKRFCQKNFVSFMRMREWRDIHRQLHLILTNLQLKESDREVDYDAIHRSLLAGLLGNIGRHDEKREYIGCRNRRFQIFPGSAIVKKKPKWLLSAELVETQQVYARYNARIDPVWIEPLAEHLVKKSWSEPHWQKKRAQVIAFEKVSLYGLEIVAKRSVNFSRIDEATSREIFIRSGLVEGQYEPKGVPVLAKNRALIQELEEIEDRTRRRDIVVDDEVIFGLYDQVIPAHIASGASFEKWYKKSDQTVKDQLAFSRDDLVREQASDFDPSLFPDHLENNGIRFPLSYQFDPGSQEDGVTISVPLKAARQVTASRLERLVPGMLREKCIQLIKNLPRTLRKHFVPVPDVVDSILPKVENSDDDLIKVLTRELKIKTSVVIPFESWDLSLLDSHLRLNVQILDDNGKVIEQGRDLVQVVDKVEHLIDSDPLPEEQGTELNQAYTDWGFGDLKAEVLTKQAGIEMKMYPAIKDMDKHVEIVNCNNQLQAKVYTRLGLARLLVFRLKPQIDLFPKKIPKYKEMALLYSTVGQAKALYDDFVLSAVANHFLSETGSICTHEEFEAIYQKGRGTFVDATKEWGKLVYDILDKNHKVMKQLKGKVNLAVALPMSDLQAQLQHLVYDNFLSHTPAERLASYPRYLEAAAVRHEKMMREMGNERKYVPILRQWWENYEARKKQLDLQGIWDDELEQFRWLIEEIRVSWYAQRLGTSETVSEKRLNKQWESVRRV